MNTIITAALIQLFESLPGAELIKTGEDSNAGTRITWLGDKGTPTEGPGPSSNQNIVIWYVMF